MPSTSPTTTELFYFVRLSEGELSDEYKKSKRMVTNLDIYFSSRKTVRKSSPPLYHPGPLDRSGPNSPIWNNYLNHRWLARV